MAGKELILTVGLPYSGKTTWAKEQSIFIVNPDSVRLALHGKRFVITAEPMVWAIVQNMVRASFLYGYERIILDACNENFRRRRQWMSPEWVTRYVVFDVDARTCRERAEAAGDDLILPVIDRKAETAEPLSIGERNYLLEVIK